jgi:predicted metal-dependent HD superfamily phosphohydrolase
MFSEEFSKAISHYNDGATSKLWSEIEKQYSSTKRYYHNQIHLENLLKELLPVRELITNWDCIVFSIAYHDIVYNTFRKDNEEKSASLAEKRLSGINFPADGIRICVEQILATKSHTVSKNPDTNLFTDADLSILGSDWSIYLEYTMNIRKEYSFYPDLVYRPGRKKVLEHFLSMDRIFKTDEFSGRYENKARENLFRERESLG